MELNSQIIITKEIDDYLEDLTRKLPLHSSRVIRNEEEGKNNFKREHANKAIKEAYIASAETKYIILCGDKFETEAQNTLLKILEEPPRNVVFIIITTSKSNLLATIFSRLPHKYYKTEKHETLNIINIFNMDLKDIYNLLKENQRISKEEAKKLVHSILHEAHLKNIALSQEELELFSKSIKLLELNSRPLNVLTTLALTILQTKR